ncbi:hypothetical protein QTG56_25500 (plasmid) [Rossellomorea sp. AcN35-11]|nr:hypothetical protein [Rossellomorea aquimaris]WJV31972.1 hypothetical protein QTG56_25500 [Rossellomorea sp. AcN35-11]
MLIERSQVKTVLNPVVVGIAEEENGFILRYTNFLMDHFKKLKEESQSKDKDYDMLIQAFYIMNLCIEDGNYCHINEDAVPEIQGNLDIFEKHTTNEIARLEKKKEQLDEDDAEEVQSLLYELNEDLEWIEGYRNFDLYKGY